MGDDERKTCGEGRRGTGNYVFRESGELPSTEELWISALARREKRCRSPTRSWLDVPAATVGRGGDGEATASTVAKINGAM